MEKRAELFPLLEKYNKFIRGDIPYETKKFCEKLFKDYTNGPACAFMSLLDWIENHNKLSLEEKVIALEYFYYSNESNLRAYVINTMNEVYFEKGYSMIVDDICTLLDLDEKYVRSTILPYVDHFQCPKYSADFFVWGTGLDFLEMARKRNKRVFVNVDSFNKYLEEHLVIKCPYVKIYYDEDISRYAASERTKDGKPKIDYADISYKVAYDLSFLKTTSLQLFLAQKKKASLLKTTKSNIISTYSNVDSGLTKEELKEQMEIACREIDNVPMQVYDKEINSFLNSDKCYRVALHPNIEDKKDKTILLCAFEKDSSNSLLSSHKLLELMKSNLEYKIKNIEEELEEDKKCTDFI